jgi:tungstate transport system substrate-binding protein
MLIFLVGSCVEPKEKAFTLATTTSVENSGLLQHLASRFREKTGIEIRPFVVGSGKALRMAREGQVSLIITHDPDGERAFVATGSADLYREFSRNDFIIAGPLKNPAAILETDTPRVAFGKIHQSSSPFASRADESGTHVRELMLWRAVGVDPRTNPNYAPLGQSMSALLRSADQLEAYVLTDGATFELLRDKLELKPYVERGPDLVNKYSVTLVKTDAPEREYAAEFARWLLSNEGREAVESFRINGRQVFFSLP